MSTPELTVRWADGSIDLLGRNESPAGDYEIETLADGTDWGNYTSVRRTLKTALLDGSRTARDRDSNRQIPLFVRVTAPSHAALVAGEQALDMIDGRRCELVWTPPTKLGVAPSVFVVDFAELKHVMDDQAYERGELFYTLTLDCLPYAYAAEWVEVEALPIGVATPVLVDDCSALTGWSSYGPTLTDGGDFIEANGTGVIRRTGAVDLTTDRYLAVEYGLSRPTQVQVRAAGGSTFITVPQVGLDGPFAIYDVGAAVDAVEFTYLGRGNDKTGRILTINKQAGLRTSASNGQVRTVAVPGSRRTPATLMLDAGDDPGDALGTAIVYSGPDYDPSLVNRLAAGSPAHFVSTAQPTLRYVMPASDLPAGEYVVWADIDGDDAGVTLDFIAELRDGSTIASETKLATLVASSTPGNRWGGLQPRFTAQLPGWPVAEGSTLDFGLRVTRTAGSETIQIPWVWLFNITSGRLIVIECGDRPKCWIEPASLLRDHPTVWSGTTTQASAVPIALDAEVRAWGGDVALSPPVSTIYTWSSTSAPMASALFRPAGHTHMGE